MASAVKILSNTKKFNLLFLSRGLSSKKNVGSASKKSSPIQKSGPAINNNVPGLSKAVLQYGDELVGPGASKTSNYKNPEYFCYHPESYFEAEIEMLKYRCPQPNSRA